MQKVITFPENGKKRERQTELRNKQATPIRIKDMM